MLDTVVFGAVIDAFEKGAQRNSIIYNVAIGACERGKQWHMPSCALTELQRKDGTASSGLQGLAPDGRETRRKPGFVPK